MAVSDLPETRGHLGCGPYGPSWNSVLFLFTSSGNRSPRKPHALWGLFLERISLLGFSKVPGLALGQSQVCAVGESILHTVRRWVPRGVAWPCVEGTGLATPRAPGSKPEAKVARIRGRRSSFPAALPHMCPGHRTP